MFLSMEDRGSDNPDLSGKKQTSNYLFCILRPILVLMQVFGLAHNVDHIQSTDKSSVPRCSAMKLYCILVLLILWQGVVRFFTVYELNDFSSLNSFVLIKVLSHLWYLFNAMNATFMFRMFHNTEKMARLFQLCGELQHTLCVCENSCECGRKRYINRRMVIIIGLSLVTISINVLGFLFAMFGPPDFFALFSVGLTPFHKADWITTKSSTAIAVKLLFTVNMAFESTAWLLPIILFVILCYYIVNMEKAFAAKMEATFQYEVDNEIHDSSTAGTSFNSPSAAAAVVADDRQLSVRLCAMRMHFLKICDTIEAANEMFQNLLGVDIVIIVAILCLLVYSLVNSPLSTYFTFYLLFWIVSQSGQLLILSYGGGLINDKAYEFQGVLHRIRALNINKDDEFQLNIFLAKLRGAPIGFTAFDLFTIDKPSILTVFGMVFTYVLFMVGLNQNSSSGSATTCAQLAVNGTG